MNNMSLLSSMSSSNVQGSGLLAAWKKNGALTQVQGRDYKKLRECAEELQKSADALQSKELYEEARKKEDAQPVRDAAERLVAQYNTALKSLNKTTSPLNQYYRETLVSTAREEQEALGSIGITQRKDGTLNVDQEKLKTTELDALEKALNGVLTERLSFLAGRIGDNAKANANSAASQYNATGNQYFAVANKYNFWG